MFHDNFKISILLGNKVNLKYENTSSTEGASKFLQFDRKWSEVYKLEEKCRLNNFQS